MFDLEIQCKFYEVATFSDQHFFGGTKIMSLEKYRFQFVFSKEHVFMLACCGLWNFCTHCFELDIKHL